MNRLAASLALLGALGASAHPSGGHGHLHGRHSHHVEERKIGDIITAVINGVTVSWTQTEDYYPTPAGQAATTPAVTTAAPSPTSTTAAAVSVSVSTPAAASTAAAVSAASASTAAAVGSGVGVKTFTSFTQYCAAKKMKRATAAEIAYKGNVGITYGCNIMLLADSQVATSYSNTIRFFGGKQDMNCLIWNKIGVDGGLDGFWGSGATTFTLAAGAEQHVAIDSNSQGGAACYAGGVAKTTWGELAGTWLEFDFENSSNQGWSGADASCIVAQTAGMAVPGLSVCSGSDCSNIAPGGAVDNAYDASLVNADGVGLKASGPMKLDVNVGYSG